MFFALGALIKWKSKCTLKPTKTCLKDWCCSLFLSQLEGWFLINFPIPLYTCTGYSTVNTKRVKVTVLIIIFLTTIIIILYAYIISFLKLHLNLIWGDNILLYVWLINSFKFNISVFQGLGHCKKGNVWC